MALPSFLGPVAGGLIGGFLDDDEPPGLTPEMRRVWRELKRVLAERRQFARSATLSTPLERQSLSQAQGLQSEMAGRSRQGLFGQQGVMDMANPGQQNRMLGNLGAAEQAQASNIYSQFALQGMQDRNNVRNNTIPQLLQQMAGIGGSYQQGGQSSGWGQIMPLMQQAAFAWGNRPSGGSQRMVNGQAVDEQGNALGQPMGSGGTGTTFRPLPINQPIGTSNLFY